MIKVHESRACTKITTSLTKFLKCLERLWLNVPPILLGLMKAFTVETTSSVQVS